MHTDYLEQVTQPDQTVNPLFACLGITVASISREKAVLSLPLKKEFIQGAGVVAGGIIATLADEAMAHVVIPNLGMNESTATIEMNIRFLRAVATGMLTAEARLVKKGRTLMTVTADVSDDRGRAVAHAGSSFMVIGKG